MFWNVGLILFLCRKVLRRVGINMDTRKKIIIAGVLMSPLVIAGCSDSESDSPLDSDVGVEGIYSLNVTGGLGGAKGGSGGDGNNVSIYKAAGTGGVEVLASGSADADFISITPDTHLGSNPLDITMGITVDVFAEDADEPAAGTPYLIENKGRLFVSDGNAVLGDEEPVTGISVASGATLTLGLNYTTYARISFNNDMFNSGVVTTVDVDELHRGGLRIYPASYVGQADSRIDTAGTQDSQNGGDVLISADYSVYNHGAINTSGSNSVDDDAALGGYVELYADYLVQNTGDIDSSGGDAPNGDAGRGGNIDLASDFGNMYNSGSLVNHGGNGQLGGNGGQINLYAVGDMLNSGDINAQGGIGGADDGGNGASIEMYAYGRKLANSGSILTMGGNTTDADSDGGDGGELYVYAEYGPVNRDAPAGGLFVSGNIDLSGGDAVAIGYGDGGTAGSADVQVYGSNYPSEVGLVFLGYTDIDATGGDANFGGSAGNVLVFNDSVKANAGVYVPSGNVTNEADVTARGGNVVAEAETIPADGGSGGNFRLETETQYGYISPELEIATNNGNIDVSGGNGLESTMTDINRSGSIWFWGYNGVTNTGNITANGGTDLGTDGGVTGYGGYANDVEMYTELGQATNSGSITNNGGAGEYRGGRSDGFKLYGATVDNSGVISSNGGNADASLEGSRSGPGGWVEFFSPSGVAGVTHSGSVSHASGTGESINGGGAFIRGGLCISGDCRPE